MKVVDQILEQLEHLIQNRSFQPLETEKIEIKPSPPDKKSAKSIFQSVCAFLNTAGGIVIVGIKESQNPRCYEFKGYFENSENLIKSIENSFTDENGNIVHIEDYLNMEIKPFMSGQVAVLYVENLPEEKKFVYFEGHPYQRKMTGDEIISKNKIQAHQDFIREIVNARELKIVANAKIEDLNVEKLNDYIQILNKEIKIETIKADINQAIPFLQRKKFVLGNDITILGMLVCGNHPEDFIGNRCQVDGFVDSEISIVQDKKVFKDNILPLMEKSVSYVYKNIQVGVSVERGGTKLPEYPEKLIRECVNNALAHRDYAIDKYVNINIKPNEYIEFRNPGAFKQSLLIEEPNHEIPIRRIIPDAKPNNPKLADILKVFDKWEGKGIGMATLVNESLEDKIDLPYYRIYGPDSIGLFIRKGKIVDDQIAQLFETYSGFIYKKLDAAELTTEEKSVLSYIYKSEIENKKYRHTILLTPDNNHHKSLYRLEKSGLIVKHPLSNPSYPLFVVDRVLAQDNFNKEIRALLGGEFDILNNDFKKVLTEIYKSNKFSIEPDISAKQVSYRLYFLENKQISDFREFDIFYRKIRYIVNQLEKRALIIRIGGKPKYVLNPNFKRTPSLFNSE